MKKLSPFDLNILRFVEWHWDKYDISPSNDEIAEHIDKPKNFVFRHLASMEQLGCVRIERGKARGIILLRTAEGAPYGKGSREVSVLGYIAAGVPIPLPDANALPLSLIKVPRSMLPDSRAIYALFVQGDSMIDVYINDGDTIFIQYQQTAENGDLVAARLHKDPTNPTTTLKRLFRDGNQTFLKPENPNYDPIPIGLDELEIQGIVVGVWRNTSRENLNKSVHLN